MSKTVTLTVEGQTLAVDTSMLHVAGTTGVYKLATKYDAEWDDIEAKIVVFIWSSKSGCEKGQVKVALEDTDGTLDVPHEVIEKPGFLTVGVLGLGLDGETKITTAPLEEGSNVIRIVKAVVDSTASTVPTPDIWAKLQAEIGDLSKLNTTAKNNLVAAINEVLVAGNITRPEVEEMIAKSTADLASKSEVEAEVTAREEAVATVTASVTSEVDARTAADAALTTKIEEETAAREAADATLTEAVTAETTNREAADQSLQSQIDGITASSDVKDVVGTKAELDAYNTATLGDNDIIKVLQDDTENDATTYYRWNATESKFVLIGEEGPYYTKSQADEVLNDKIAAVSSQLPSPIADITDESSIDDTTNYTLTGAQLKMILNKLNMMEGE